jgi:hypothetical protein
VFARPRGGMTSGVVCGRKTRSRREFDDHTKSKCTKQVLPKPGGVK